MRKSDVMKYFDACAAEWDIRMIKSDEIICEILDIAGVQHGKHILDVACGTGVLVPYYLERGVASVTAVDLSTEMIRFAQEKFPLQNVCFHCGDAESMVFDRLFDSIVVYNAFPHFPNPSRLIHHLSALLNKGGKLTVAHGMSRAEIDRRHQGSASKVSVGLLHEDELAAIFAEELELHTKISDERMYVVTGIKR